MKHIYEAKYPAPFIKNFHSQGFQACHLDQKENFPGLTFAQDITGEKWILFINLSNQTTFTG